MREKKDYDVVVIGSGPNGLAAAIALQREGLSVLVCEGSSSVGGGLRSLPLTLPGFVHDQCAAVHPMARGSIFFNQLPLAEFGLEFIQPPLAAAHPFDDGGAALLSPAIAETAASLGQDASAYEKLMRRLVKDWPGIFPDIMAPLHFPSHPLAYARFGCKAILSANRFARHFFSGAYARGLFAGMAAHAMRPLTAAASASYGLVLMTLAHTAGWPIAKGGSQRIADALARYFLILGGKISLDFYVSSLSQIPSCHAIMFDTAPLQLLEIAGHRLSRWNRGQLARFRYGMGVFKIDWALAGPIPFINRRCADAGTIHLGNSYQEISASERLTAIHQYPDKPYVLLSQPSLFDPGRAPAGKHTAWAYCHTPAGSTVDRTQAIENQVERYAPGFRDLILARHTLNATEMERYNPNYVGGDINGGEQSLTQLFTRPTLRLTPYRTSARGIYICSASSPPGGGAHGMCGYHAAKRVLRDIF